MAAGCDGFAAQLPFRQLDELGRPVPQHGAIGRELVDERLGVLPPHRAGRSQQADDARDAGLRRRLDRRHRADDGHRESIAQRRKGDRAGGIARDDDQVRMKPLRQSGEQIAHARHKRGFFLGAVGEVGVVGDVEEPEAGQGGGDAVEYAEAADAGVEDDGRGHQFTSNCGGSCCTSRRRKVI